MRRIVFSLKAKKKLRIDGRPRIKNKGRESVISNADVTKLIACFEQDYTVTQALTEADVPRRSFYRRWKADDDFRHRMEAAKASAMIAIKSNLFEKAKKDPYLGLKILERREKREWSPKIDPHTNVAPIKIVFDKPTQFGDPNVQVKPETEEEMGDAEFFS